VAAVFLCLWLVGNLGFTLVLWLTGPWLMPSTSDLTLLVTMLGAFYGARVASQFIALYFASLIIAHSRVARPYLVLATLFRESLRNFGHADSSRETQRRCRAK
jgi:hypothetical protein